MNFWKKLWKKLSSPFAALVYSMLIVCFTIGTIVVIAFSWFTNTELVEPDLSGFSVSAYFGGGNGSEDDPFLIKNQRHLYNLCWLQYLGYFNKEGALDSNGRIITQGHTTEITQYSFSIENDLNMSGWYLPPLGTSLNPFVGELNGNGHSISNLHTTNTFTEFGTKHPSSVNSSNFANVEIIGFIGVIGEIDSMRLSDHTFDTSANTVANIKLNETQVNTTTPHSLVGIVAGYINGIISDVGIVKSGLNISSGTSKLDNNSIADISTYTVAGYATTQYLTAVKNTKTIVINPTTLTTNYVYADEGDEVGWGGSIDFLTLYNNLKTEWNRIVNTNHGTGGITYNTTRTITIDSDGNSTVVDGGATENFIASNSGTSAFSSQTYNVPSNLTPNTDNLLMRFYDISKSTTVEGINYKTSSYSLMIENATQNMQKNEWQYMCLTGYSTKTMLNAMTVTTRYPDAEIIADYYGNYLTYNERNDTVANSTDVDTTTRWYFDENNHIYFLNDTTKTYLLDNNGSMSLSTDVSNATVWLRDSEYIQSTNYNNYLVCDNGTWKLQQNRAVTVSGGFTIKSGNYTYDYGGNTVFFWDNNNKLFFYDGGVKTYLQIVRIAGNYYVGDTLDSSSTYVFAKYNQTRIRAKYGNNTTRYLYCNNGNWGLRSNDTSLTFASATITDDFIINIYDSPNVVTTINSSFQTPDTYFPLNSNNGVPDQKNTGYIVSGANFYGDIYGDIRISGFQISSSLANAGGSNLSTVRTIDSTGDHTISNTNSYQKYSDSYTAMKSVLTSSTNIDGTTGYVYGLHFMDAQIAMTTSGHEVRIPYAVINGQEYYNYQVPADCIDFNLKEKGYINFFAGTYYQRTSSDNTTRNSCFFSLYDIFRSSTNNTNLADIKEIVEIYEDSLNKNYSYVYKYSDGTYSIPYKYAVINGSKTKVKLDGSTYDEYNRVTTSLYSGYTNCIFKTEWIKGHKGSNGVSTLTHNAAYYFEIPMNGGEYCLGSVVGHNGAYLMYLDIGANAQQVNRTEIRQKSTVSEYDFTFPKGIAVITANTTIDPTNASLDAAQSAVIKITSSTGNIYLERTGTNVIDATGTLSTAESTYIPRSMTLRYNSGAMTATAVRTTTSIYSQILYIDHNVTSGDIYETVIQKVDSNNPTYNVYKIGINGTTAGFTRTEIDQTAQKPEWKLYAVVDNKNVSVDLTNASDTNANAIKSALTSIANTTVTAANTILAYEYDTSADATNTYAIHINTVLDTNSSGSYYVFTGDDITMTTDNVGGTIIYVNVSNTTYTFRLLNNDHTTNMVVGTNITIPLQ